MTPSDLNIIERALSGQEITSEEAERAMEAVEAMRKSRWDQLVLTTWAALPELGGRVTLEPQLGDCATWLCSFSRETDNEDPEELSADDPSYYDEDGRRVWDFEAESADEAFHIAALHAWELLPPADADEIGECP